MNSHYLQILDEARQKAFHRHLDQQFKRFWATPGFAIIETKPQGANKTVASANGTSIIRKP